MPKSEQREIVVGSFALLALIAALALTAMANRVSERGQDAVARYTAEFARADGLHQGAPVRLAGVNIGSVGEVALDGRYRAVLTLVLDQDVPLPDDTAAIIETDGVFGTKYIELQPGGSEIALKPGGRLGYTQDSVIIEDLITKIVEQAKATAKKNDAATPNN
jgi:phospholipid/cholesterol/gamma-HCH transport system substrate-binding protein